MITPGCIEAKPWDNTGAKGPISKLARAHPTLAGAQQVVFGSLWPARYVRIVYTRTYTVLQTRARPPTTPFRTTGCDFEGCRI